MSSSAEQPNWRDELTAEQQTMVEKAARAAHEAAEPIHGIRGYWDRDSEDSRELRRIEALAALRAVGIIQAAKPKTNGERRAGQMIREDSGVIFCHRVNGSLDFSFPAPDKNPFQAALLQENLHRMLADAIDFERQKAFIEAAHIAENISAHPVNYTLTNDWPELVARKISAALVAKAEELKNQSRAKVDGVSAASG